ncbi:MAG: polysaccharide pyruvyl transferase CsaB [Bacillota bacterium]|nr:polysaccharide pyruvyl transferase CsaB [Bacillota bacterium]
MPLNITISGYYGFHNAGDEAILFSIIQELKGIEPNVVITVLSNDPDHTEKAYGVKAVNRWHLPSIVKAVSNSQLFISGGGSLLQDVTSKKNVIYYLGVVGIAQAFGVPTFFYSQGIGPLRTGFSRKLLSLAIKRAAKITVRDQASAQLIADLGVDMSKLEVTADPVLGLARENIDLSFGKQLLTGTGLDLAKPKLGVVLRDWHRMDEIRPVLAKWAREVQNQGWQLVLIAFHSPEDITAHSKLVEQIQKDMKTDEPISGLVQLGGGYSPMEYLSLIGNLDFVVGMRLHALIMAAVMEVPMAGISYDPKIDAFLKLVKQPIVTRLDDSLEIGDMLLKLITSLKDRDRLKEELLQTLAELQVKAKSPARQALLIANGNYL